MSFHAKPRHYWAVSIALVIATVAIVDAATDGYVIRGSFATAINAVFKTTPATRSDGDFDTLNMNSTGALHVSIQENVAGSTTQNVSVTSWFGSTAPTVGQKTKAASLPVALASDQDALPVTDNAGSLTVDNAALSVTGGGVEATALRVTLASDGTGLVSVDDNAGSITVDSAQLPAALGGGAETGALLVTVANDSTGVLSVDDNAGALTVDWAGTAPPIGAGVEATALRVTVATDSTGVLSVDDNAGSLTVDNAALSVTGGGVEAGTLRVTLASDSTGVLSVDDNAGSLTVDSAQLPSALGAGTEAGALRVTLATDSTGVVSVDDNGGALTVDWAGTAPPIGAGLEATALRVTLATDSTGVVSVDDNGASLTVDNSTLAVVGGGTEATAMRVTLASDSTGVVSVDDNGGAITVDWAGTAPPIGAGLEATALRVTLATDSTGVVSVDDNGASLTVDVGTALPAGDNNVGNIDVASMPADATELPAAAALADGASNPTTPFVGAGLLGFNGTTWDRLRSDTTNGLDVDVTRMAALVAGSAIIGQVSIDQTTPGTTNLVQIGGSLPAGTAAIGKLAANSGVDIGDVDITSIAAGDNNIGNVDVASMPADATELPAAAAAADGASNPTAPFVQGASSLFNGTTWDRARGNWDSADALSGAATATRQSGTLTNYNAKGILITLDVTSASATDSLTTLNVQTAINAGWITIHSFTLTGIGNSTSDDIALLVYPGAATAGSYHVAPAQGIVPRTFRIEVVHGDANSITYDVDVSLVN